MFGAALARRIGFRLALQPGTDTIQLQLQAMGTRHRRSSVVSKQGMLSTHDGLPEWNGGIEARSRQSLCRD